MTTMPQPMPTQVTVGVDTHADIHVAVAKDPLRLRLDAISVATTPAGYAELLDWARRLGQPDAWGIEGTGFFGAGLVRFLRAHGQVVVEVNRPRPSGAAPTRQVRPLDAEAAARTAQAREGSIPKAGDGPVEMIRSLRVARTTAMKARTQAINALKALVVTAPAELREQLRGLSTVCLAQITAELKPGPVTTPLAAATLGLRALARTRAGRCWWPPATTPIGCTRMRPSRCCAAPPRSRSPRARRAGIGSIGVVTAKPTRRCTGSWWPGCAMTSRPRTTWPAASVRASRKEAIRCLKRYVAREVFAVQPR